MRLHSILAKAFEKNQCFSFVVRFLESLEIGAEMHPEHQSKLPVQLDQSIVLGFLFNSIQTPNQTTL